MKPDDNLTSFGWSVSQLGVAINYLAEKYGLNTALTQAVRVPQAVKVGNDQAMDRWLGQLGQQVGLEMAAVSTPYADLTSFITQAGPIFIQLPPPDSSTLPQFLVILKGHHRWSVTVLKPDLSTCRVAPQQIRNCLAAPLEAPYHETLNRLLQDIPPHRRPNVAQLLLNRWLARSPIENCWLVRVSTMTSIWSHIKQAKLPHYLGGMTLIRLVRELVFIVSWAGIGYVALNQQVEVAWVIAWALLVVMVRPLLLLLENWLQALLALKASILFKTQLLANTLRLNPEKVRHQGSGQFLGRILESEAIETLAITGGFGLLDGLIHLISAMIVLSLGNGGILHAWLFLGWFTLALLLMVRYLYSYQQWVESYHDMTNDLVEHMVGHRTRLAQEEPSQWHTEEDVVLATYLRRSERLDDLGLALIGFIPRGWLMIGVLTTIYSFIVFPSSTTDVVISLGGILLAKYALDSLVLSLNSLANLLIAWQQVAPLYQATESTGLVEPLIALMQGPSSKDKALLMAREVMFRYQEHQKPTLDDCSLTIYPGDKILLEGASGGGKSTLAAILVGLHPVQSGLLLWRGVDQKTLGLSAWRKQIASAPQFHENHVLVGPLAFNLLMGREWPASYDSIMEAEQVCRELGLGALIDRMPAGLFQIVGETGWQLSHGERSRVYIARALLQRADFVVLDESFAALDPENLRQALQCVLNRVETVLVIAHP